MILIYHKNKDIKDIPLDYISWLSMFSKDSELRFAAKKEFIKRGFIMEATTVRDFREKLSSWFNKAKKNPVFISRKEERFVMISEEYYFEMKDQIDSLKTSLISALSDEETFTAKELKKGKQELKKEIEIGIR